VPKFLYADSSSSTYDRKRRHMFFLEHSVDEAMIYTLKNAPTLASCSFDTHGLTLTNFGQIASVHFYKWPVPSLLLTIFAFK